VFKAPPAENRSLRVQRDLRVPAPDGIDLLTDLYLTTATEPQPAVLIRTPYGRRGMFGVIARLFAERGYHVVCQSTRGTFGSGGDLDPTLEAEDGRATADWIIKQPWSNGDIGTYGASYLSYVQWALASTRPPQLKAMAILVYGAERRAGNYPGGSFALGRALNWTYVVNKQLRRGPRGIGRALQPAMDHLPLGDAATVAVGHPVPLFRDWLEHDAPGDPYWASTDFRPILRDLDIPVTMVAGWYDIYLPHMLEDYQALRAAGQQVRLRVGAWRHGSLGMQARGLRDALELFDQHLRHRPPRRTATPEVSIEVMGDGWRDLDHWPPAAPTTQCWYLQPDGTLSATLPPQSEPDRYRYDPADPTPAVGGSTLGANAGPMDNRELEKRPDVLTYTTAPLTKDVEIIGPVSASLFVSSSLAHTDFFARICDVDPRGRSVNITDGLLRLRPGDQAATPGEPIAVELWPTAHRFRAGHQIRLQVSSGAHPRYVRNLGTGEPLATGTTMLAADQAVYHDPRQPSAVLLPVARAHRASPPTNTSD
jgi:putative CocE/NonD family hydrolase